MIPLFNEDMRILKETNTELLSHTYDETYRTKYFFLDKILIIFKIL